MADHRDDVSVVGSIVGSDSTVGFRELGECLIRDIVSIEAHELGDDAFIPELESWIELEDIKIKNNILKIIRKAENIFHEKKVKIAGVGQGKQQVAIIKELKEELEKIMRLQMKRGSSLVNLSDFIYHLDETIDLLEKTKKIHKEVKKLRSLCGRDSGETHSALRNAIRCKGFIENFREKILGKSREEQARVQAQAVRALREAQQELKDYRSVWAKEIVARSMGILESDQDLIQSLAEYSVQNQNLLVPAAVSLEFIEKVLKTAEEQTPDITRKLLENQPQGILRSLAHSGTIDASTKSIAISIARSRRHGK